jgi:tetratricopeptide (TPR) repeat protein
MLLRGELKRGVKWLEEVIDRWETQHEYQAAADFTRLFLAEFYLALMTGGRKPSMGTVLRNAFFIMRSRRIAPERAEALLMRAIQNPLFSERGTFHARIAFNLGLLHRTMKRPEVARRWFEKAHAAASAQNAANWLAKIDAALASL